MKKNSILMLCFLLGGCGPSFKIEEGPSPGTRYTHQLAAPFPWVRIIPSERAIALKQVDFENVADKLRFLMSFDEQKKGTYENVCLVLMDYTILQEKKPKEGKDIICQGEVFLQQDEPLPERYMMSLRFYKKGRQPPAPPDFQGTATTPVVKSHAQEAMLFLVDEITKDHEVSPCKKIDVKLD